MLKHQRHFNSLEQDISSGRALFRDLEVAMESLGQAFSWNEAFLRGDSTHFPCVGMESETDATPSKFQEALKRVKELIAKAVEFVRKAFDALVRWLTDRGEEVQRAIKRAKDKLSNVISPKIELHGNTPLECVGIDRMMKHDAGSYFSIHNLREMVRALGHMVDQTVKNNGGDSEGLPMLLTRYDRFTYLWLVGHEGGSDSVPTKSNLPGYELITTYLADAPRPLDAFDFMLRNAPTDVSCALTKSEAVGRLEAMHVGLRNFSRDVVTPRRDSDKLLTALTAIDEIVSEEQWKQVRAMVLLINRNMGNITSGYNFQVRIARAAVHSLELALQ